MLMCPSLCAAAVFNAERGWLVTMRHEHVWWGPSPPLALYMGTDPRALDVSAAADSQFLFDMDNATLGADVAQQRYGKPWLKAEDLR